MGAAFQWEEESRAEESKWVSSLNARIKAGFSKVVIHHTYLLVQIFVVDIDHCLFQSQFGALPDLIHEGHSSVNSLLHSVTDRHIDTHKCM